LLGAPLFSSPTVPPPFSWNGEYPPPPSKESDNSPAKAKARSLTSSSTLQNVRIFRCAFPPVASERFSRPYLLKPRSTIEAPPTKTPLEFQDAPVLCRACYVNPSPLLRRSSLFRLHVLFLPPPEVAHPASHLRFNIFLSSSPNFSPTPQVMPGIYCPP